MVRFLLRGAVVVGVASLAAGALAQDLAVERGRTIAETWCVACHAIGNSNQASALADAPPFKTLAARADFDEETVRRVLLLPHPVMPEFPVTNADVAAIAAYISSLSDDGAAPAQPAEQRTQAAPPPEHVLVGSADEAARGRAIVERDCSPCHRVEGLGPSPVPDAPAFATLSERYPVSYLAEALAEGIMVGHEGVQMPQFEYDPKDIGAIIAHLESVQQK